MKKITMVRHYAITTHYVSLEQGWLIHRHKIDISGLNNHTQHLLILHTAKRLHKMIWKHRMLKPKRKIKKCFLCTFESTVNLMKFLFGNLNDFLSTYRNKQNKS